MAPNREWLENWLSARAPRPADAVPDNGATVERQASVNGHLLANLSPAGQRRLMFIMQQNPVAPPTRFVAFRAESFREKDLLDSFEAMVKSPARRTEARYVPLGGDGALPEE